MLITYRYIPFPGTLGVPNVAPETEKVPYTLQVRNTSLFPIIEMICPSEFCTMTLEYWEYLLFEIFRVFVPFILSNHRNVSDLTFAYACHRYFPAAALLASLQANSFDSHKSKDYCRFWDYQAPHYWLISLLVKSIFD